MSKKLSPHSGSNSFAIYGVDEANPYRHITEADRNNDYRTFPEYCGLKDKKTNPPKILGIPETPLTIEETKRRLALTCGLKPEQIDILIKKQ